MEALGCAAVAWRLGAKLKRVGEMEADAESCLIAAGCADACLNARSLRVCVSGRSAQRAKKGQTEDKEAINKKRKKTRRRLKNEWQRSERGEKCEHGSTRGFPSGSFFPQLPLLCRTDSLLSILAHQSLRQLHTPESAELGDQETRRQGDEETGRLHL